MPELQKLRLQLREVSSAFAKFAVTKKSEHKSLEPAVGILSFRRLTGSMPEMP